jgi:oligosaccharide translocation protein RFT1
MPPKLRSASNKSKQNEPPTTASKHETAVSSSSALDYEHSTSSSGSDSSSSSSSYVIKSALKGGKYLFLQKILTFVINSFILRKLHLSITGAVTVQLELALATIFLLRDGFRLGFLRVRSLETTTCTKETYDRTYLQQLVNVAWLSTLISWCIAFSIGITIPLWLPKDASEGDLKDYQHVIVMYCLAAMIEALAEPMYVLAHCSMFVSWQVTAQGTGFLVRGVVQYICIFFLDMGLMAYGLAEMAYATMLLVTFTYFYWKRIYFSDDTSSFALKSFKDLVPKAPSTFVYFEPELLSLLLPLSVQSSIKYLLTEGDKWVLSVFDSLQNMGVYGIVFHLGSLVPRILFLPIEEATKTIFSKMMVHSTGNNNTNHQSDDEAIGIILVLLKVMNLIGLVFVCFGTNYAQTLILFLYGIEKASLGVPEALAWYCAYVYFLALNGICEAFVHAVGNQKQLMFLNKLMGVFFILYCMSARLFMKTFEWGTIGLILANCVNMGCRIVYCLTFMAHFFKRQNGLTFWMESLPHTIVLFTLGVCFCITRFSSQSLPPLALFDGDLNDFGSMIWKPHLIHLAIGILSFKAFCLTLFLKETTLLSTQLKKIQQARKKA